ncbi:MAG: LemA family protein [Sphaerochaetaceae bacterium]|jgi:LemA protein|nr:LemA family protein [Sphaerochaetaceae bacterium]
MIVYIIVILAVVIIAGWFVSAYNRFIVLKNQGEEAASQIDAHLKQRFDLVPNLVETVKGYAKHEKETLDAVITARNSAMNATGIEAKDAADKGLTASLKSLFALAEAYPDLKANEGFVSLQKQLSDIETQILSARKYYNGVVKAFNTSLQTFPSSIVAGIFASKFTKLPYLQIDEAERQNVKVQF